MPKLFEPTNGNLVFIIAVFTYPYCFITGNNKLDDELILLTQLVPTLAWRKLISASVPGVWSSLVIVRRNQCPALKRLALATSGMR